MNIREWFNNRKNDQILNRYSAVIDDILEFESQYGERINELSEDDNFQVSDFFSQKTEEFRDRLEEGESLEAILPEAYALVSEASAHILGMRPYKVQLMGGIALNEQAIAEMKTGEGKTLAATTATYLNALSGEGVHVITVNDYLAQRDAEWMGPLFESLGLTVGAITQKTPEDAKREAYKCDITYGTAREFGFDFLRDNAVKDISKRVQRGHNFALIDEADSILIDESKTPMIMSEQTSVIDVETYRNINAAVKHLYQKQLQLEAQWTQNERFKGIKDNKSINNIKDEEGWIFVDKKENVAAPTDKGRAYIERLLEIPDLSTFEIDFSKDVTPEDLAKYERYNDINATIMNATKAWTLFEDDIDYIVKNGEVVLLDMGTGRISPGTRYSEGLHQAIEAKENLRVMPENRTLVSITTQFYFRLYDKIAGMTGTAKSEEKELGKVYNLNVVQIPTNKEVQRIDEPDRIYRNKQDKYEALIQEIKEQNKNGRPILIGTSSVKDSEEISNFLRKYGIKHNLLNAKNHESEAEIVAEAGRYGAVTVATNMAGRGTDIILGGNPDYRNKDEWKEEHDKIIELGGLCIIGTSRHESRRIDDQLRGRAGRQGDPGSSVFYISLEDELMQMFAPQKILNSFSNIYDQGTALSSPMLSKAIKTAQSQLEAANAKARENVLKFGEITERQRSATYGLRDVIVESQDVKEQMMKFIDESVGEVVDRYFTNKNIQETTPGVSPNYAKMAATLKEDVQMFCPKVNIAIEELGDIRTVKREELYDAVESAVKNAYAKRERQLGNRTMRVLEKQAMLRSFDNNWANHLQRLDELRSGSDLQSYGQRDPYIEYIKDSSRAFTELQSEIKKDSVRNTFVYKPANKIFLGRYKLKSSSKSK